MSNIAHQQPLHAHNLHWTARVPKSVKYAFNGVASAFLLLMFAQIVWPSGLTTPLLRQGNQAFGLKTRGALEHQLTMLSQSELLVTAGDNQYKTSFADAGLRIDAAATSEQYFSYPWYDRFQPFTLFRRNASVPQLHFDDAKLTALAETIAQENQRKPQNALVKQENGEYKVARTSAQGTAYAVDSLVEQLKQTNPAETTALAAAAEVVEPSISTEDAEESIQIIKQQTTRNTVIIVADQQFTIPKKELKRFISIDYNRQAGTLRSAYNRAAINRYVTSIQKKVFIAARPAVVRTLDGEVTARSAGKKGQTISVEAAQKTVIQSLKKRQAQMEFPLVATTAATQFTRNYSATNKGLQILIQDWQADTGLNAGVVVRELGGRGRTAAINGGKSFLLASLSKLYLVDYLYYRVSSGSLKMSSKLGTGMTVAHCIERMIVVSDNTCFNTFGAAVGWSKVSAYAASSGFTATNPNPGVYVTTAYDVADYFQRLQNGSLMSAGQRSQLLGYLQSQIYRSGIPLGSGVTVADKVGYYGGYRHDAGIVYHPNSTYVLTVLTNGGTNAQISDLARRISTNMNK